MFVIPKIVTGFDIETLSTSTNAYVSSISLASFNVNTLELVDKYDYIIGLNDATQVNRHQWSGTLDWWKGMSDTSPDPAALAVLTAGNGNLKDALLGFMDYFKRLDEVVSYREHAIVSKGPDFDPVIIQNAFRSVDLKYPLRYSTYDSARTVERVIACLELPKVKYDHLAKHTLQGKVIPHVSLSDALMEGYTAAKLYNTLLQIKSVGIDYETL